MRHGYYKLVNRQPVKVNDVIEWARDLEKDRSVAQDTIGDVRISTVFIGIDHQWADGPPLLFETMIFGGKHDDYQERYATWQEAELGHTAAVAIVSADAG